MRVHIFLHGIDGPFVYEMSREAFDHLAEKAGLYVSRHLEDNILLGIRLSDISVVVAEEEEASNTSRGVME